MNRSVFMCLILFCSFTTTIVFASVTVEVNQKQYVFISEPFLEQVLAPLANNKNWYWPSAAMYRTADYELENKRQQLIADLQVLVEFYQSKNPEISSSLENIQANINLWQLARRLPIKIDYDLARVLASANPRLTAGNYVLNVTPRVDKILLFGAINNVINVPHLPYSDASEYISDKFMNDLADKDYVIVLQADGRKIITPVAYWNKTHQEVMPGSLIFIPFKESPFHPELASINQQIIALALNWVR